MFEIASRKKLRVKTSIGELTVEQLWDLPLTSTRGVNLDDIAIKLSQEITKQQLSFVSDNAKKEDADLKVLFDIVIHIIEVRKNEAKAAQEKASNLSMLKMLKELRAEKQTENLKALSQEELDKKIAELEGSL